MERHELIDMLQKRQWAKNLFISDKQWPLVLTTENDPAIQQDLLREFGGNIETMWPGRKEAGQKRWAVQYDAALPVLAELRPYLQGWRAKAADVWLNAPRRETHAVADIYP